MQKTWKDIYSEVIHLGFEKDSAYSKYKNSFVSAFNWAQTLIATKDCPIYANTEAVKENGMFGFSHIDNFMYCVGIFDADGKFLDYTLENIDSLPDGKYTVKYRKYPDVCDGNDNYICELDYKFANILPYLIAHRVWLDDDMSKAVLYWNTYEDLKNQIQSNSCSIEVSEGWGV